MIQLSAVQSYTQTPQGLLFNAVNAQISLSVLTDQIVHVRFAPQGQFAARRSWAVTPADEAFAPVPFTVTEGSGYLTLITSSLSIQINDASGQLAFTTPQGQPFCADSQPVVWGDPSNPQAVECFKVLSTAEHFYGFGERADQLDQTGRRITNWTTDKHRYGPGNDPLYIAIPVFLSLQPGLCYGIFLNNTWRSQFDMGASRRDIWSMRVEGGELDYYLVYGPQPAQVMAGLGQLLGRTPLPPRWALGYHQSRYSYASEAEVREVTSQLRQRQIPCDVIHLDIHHMQDYRDFTWDPQRFPDPKTLIHDLTQSGFQVVTIADPGVKIDPYYPVFRTGLQANAFIRRSNGDIFHGFVWPDDSVFPDFTRPDVRRWWASMQNRMLEVGVSGIWNDMNEPTVFELPFSQGGGQPKGVDADAIQGPPGEQTTHAEVHNLYGSGMVQASYEGLREYRGLRPFVLTRAGFAGVQRYSACWMGDNTARWEQLEMAIPQLLNMGLSGVPFVGTDIGGFFDNTSPELFARWMQFGALMPLSRGHTAVDTGPHEPWVFGPQVEAICRDYLQLRYRLLPYLYSLFWESSRTAAPVLRPLFYEYPEDATTYALHDQALLGSALLAAPVYQPGRTHRAVYLPDGQWFDWWTDARLEGPLHLLADAPLDRMPLYVRAGTILPLGSPTNLAANPVLDPLILECYWGEGSFTLYEDDGQTFDHEQGQFCTTQYTLEIVEGRLRLSAQARQGAYQPASRQLQLRLHGLPSDFRNPPSAGVYDPTLHLWTHTLTDDGSAFSFVF